MNEKCSNIIAYLRKKIKGSSWEGHLFVVGGYCRDLVMGKPIHDIDLTVDLPLGSLEFARWLHSRRLTCGQPTVFPRYATARLRLRAFPDDDIEIVQTRSDKYGPHNSDNPAAAFGSLQDDCTRRDLTINSLYYDISADTMLDLSGMAIDDISNHIIRTPADPLRTFDDDPLRILRCIRFACSLNWQIDPSTYQAMCASPQAVLVASKERIRNEFDKLLVCSDPVRALNLMYNCGVLAVIMPELAALHDLPDNSSNGGTVWQHTMRTVEAMARMTDNIGMRLAALLYDVGKTVCMHTRDDGRVTFPNHDRRVAAVIDPMLRRLRYEPRLINDIIFLARNHTALKSAGADASKLTDADLRRLQLRCGNRQNFNRLLMLIDADNRSHLSGEYTDQIRQVRTRAAAIKDSHTEMFDYHLPINSLQIRRLLQIAPGRKVEQCKDFLMNLAFDNPAMTRNDCRRLLVQRFKKMQK